MIVNFLPLIDKFSINVSTHLQGDSESEASESNLETKVLTDGSVQGVRYKNINICMQ